MAHRNRFDTVYFSSTTVLKKEGIEIKGFIAGVNSGMYSLPYVIQVSTWASKWFWSKFFRREMKLNLMQVRQLREECDKVIKFYEEKDIKTDEQI